ncbi:MAG: hypothetical protein AB7F86_08515 [Bdellovibrionales bacterium]
MNALILILSATFVWAAKPSSNDVEGLLKSYLKKPNLADDQEDLAACSDGTCRVEFRSGLRLHEDLEAEDVGEELAQDDVDFGPAVYEAHLDIFKDGKIFARRNGCYLITKEGSGWRVQNYVYECKE